MLNIVIPMAGLGSRFAAAGISIPKPLIPVHGKSMIQVVVDNLAPETEHRFIFICQNAHIRQYDLVSMLRTIAGSASEVIGIDGITEGQVCSVLKAKHLIDNDDPLMTANADQFVDFNVNDYLADMETRNLDGLIMTMKSDDPKWSYAKTDDRGYVVETAEKKVISEDATVGIFNFRHGRDLVWAAEKMIADDVRVNNEFYTCPCYNYLVAAGRKIGVHGVGKEYAGMYGLGIPSDLEFFVNHPVSEKVK